MESTYFNDLAHYDLAINVALLWLNEEENQEVLKNEKVVISSRTGSKYPNEMEREAMILSSFAGILMNSIPLEDILKVYRYKPSVTQFCRTITRHVHSSSLSLHPFAMLTAVCAAKHPRKQVINPKGGKIAAKQNFKDPSTTNQLVNQPGDICSGTQQSADPSDQPEEEKVEEEKSL
ncbi:uncharacterized protein C2orf80 [Mustelus asterias]